MSGWIRVKDAMPEPWEKVLVYMPYPNAGDRIGIDYIADEVSGWMRHSYETITHWRKTPEPPEEDEE